MNATPSLPTVHDTAGPAEDPSLRPPWLPPAVWPHDLRALQVGGRRVVYTDTGGEGPALLFSHTGQWCLLWGGVIAALADRYRCITFDPPGTGLSERVPPEEQTLDTAAAAARALIDHLDLRDLTLVLHDLGGLTALAAASTCPDRIAGVVAINTFGWRPRGLMLPVGLRLFGSALVRELDAFTGLLPRASSTRFGVGRHLDRATRRAWRAGLGDRGARRQMHRRFKDGARNHAIHAAAEQALERLTDRPLLTIFGQLGDYFRFERQWRRHHPGPQQHRIRRGLHFPMCDQPAGVARLIDGWVQAARSG